MQIMNIQTIFFIATLFLITSILTCVYVFQSTTTHTADMWPCSDILKTAALVDWSLPNSQPIRSSAIPRNDANSSCAEFAFNGCRFHEFQRCCVDGQSKLFTNGNQCLDNLHLNPFHVSALPSTMVDFTNLRGKGFLIDCWMSAAVPSHLFMGLTQATYLIDWLNETGTSIEWIVTRGCSMHFASPVSAAVQIGLDAVLFSSGFLSNTKIPLWDLPLESPKLTCFDHAVFCQMYGVFPPVKWRGHIMRSLNNVIGLVPAEARPCRSRVTAGLYFRSNAHVNYLRRICNQNAVIRAIGVGLGGQQVLSFTTNSTMSLAEQISAFDKFDLLFGPHGSHWAISWFANRPRVVVEIQPVLASFDLAQAIESKGPGHHFLVSAGHRFLRNDCGGLNHEITDVARRTCPAENFDGTSLLCDARAQCGIRACSGEKALKYQSTEANLTAVASHARRLLDIVQLPQCLTTAR